MELIIGEVLKSTVAPNSFYVEIKTMTGDADMYHYLTVGPFLKEEDEDALENFLNLLQRLAATRNPHTWETIEDFIGWFSGMDREYDENEWRNFYPDYTFYSTLEKTYAFANRIINRNGEMFEWPYDVYMENFTKYVSHTVHFYDENRVKYAVQEVL